MTNYESGRRFEYRVVNFFREKGFKAKRKASSSPYDVLVLKEGRCMFVVDAKKTSQRNQDYIYLQKKDLKKIVRLGRELKAEPLITYGFYRSPIYVEFPEGLLEERNNNKTVRLEEGKKLGKFLEDCV